MQKITIGIDIGGTNTEFGIVNEVGKCIAKGKIRTDKYDDVNLFVSELTLALNRLLQSIPSGSELIGIGIGAPNGNYYNGTIEFAPNLKWKGIIPLVQLMKSNFNTNIYLTNDANAAAIGEKIYGGAKNMSDFILITLGTGLGSGFYANGKLIYGHDGFAGELGHTIYDENGRQCGCGRKGCLETYASAKGIVKTVLELLKDNSRQSILRKKINSDSGFQPESDSNSSKSDSGYQSESDSVKITAKDIYDAALENDEIALDAFDYSGNVLGLKLSDAVAITSPEAIFMFGGLAQAGKFIFEPTKKYMEQYLLPIFRNKVKLLPSELPENEAAILGAAALVFENLKEKK
jgi:glucokinase